MALQFSSHRSRKTFISFCAVIPNSSVESEARKAADMSAS